MKKTNNDPFVTAYDGLLADARRILLSKATVYSTPEDRYKNFRRASEIIGNNTTPHQALLGMAAKHLEAWISFCHNPHSAPLTEWREKVVDLINYLAMSYILTEATND